MEVVTPEETVDDSLTEVKVKFEFMEAITAKQERSSAPASFVTGIEKPSLCKILYPVLKIDGKYNYKCCICPKVFHQLSNLKAHWRTHSGERPFKCQKCQKLFVQRAHLIKHLPTHSGGKSFACTLCGKKFAKAMALASHRRQHGTENSHECHICGASFLEMSHLMNHERRVHQSLFGVKQGFVCKNCRKVYKSRSSLTLHCKRSLRCRSRWEADLKLSVAKPATPVEVEVIDISGDDKAAMVNDPETPGPSSSAVPLNLVQNVQLLQQPGPAPVAAAVQVQEHTVRRLENLTPAHSRIHTQDPPTYEQHVQAHYERHYQHQMVSTQFNQQLHMQTPYQGTYQQPTQYLKQTLLGATPSQEYYYYNWNYAPNNLATPAPAPAHTSPQPPPPPQPAHQYQEQQHPVFYDNGPYYQDVWYNNHNDTDMNRRSQ